MIADACLKYSGEAGAVVMSSMCSCRRAKGRAR